MNSGRVSGDLERHADLLPPRPVHASYRPADIPITVELRLLCARRAVKARGGVTINPRSVEAAAQAETRSHDAIVIIPGIMGSTLVESETGRTLWNSGRAIAIAARWRDEEWMRRLRVTDEERGGRIGRVQPAGLLAGPAWMPGIGGVEPYRDLVRAVSATVLHPDAILRFAYDWRLSTKHNAGLLAKAMHAHLASWRKHPARLEHLRQLPERPEAGLVLVAHSMGGLLVRDLALIQGGYTNVRSATTIGTPFSGSMKAVELLAHGRGAPLPFDSEHLRNLVRTLPGVYDLLPTYRCVQMTDTVRALTGSDITAIGADAELAAPALSRAGGIPESSIPAHRSIVGTTQHTPQTVRLADGSASLQLHSLRHSVDGTLTRGEGGLPIEIDYGGDGTVYRYAASLANVDAIPVAQQHGALPRSPSVIDIVSGHITEVEDLGLVLGLAELRLTTPDEGALDTPIRIEISGEIELGRVTCRVEAADRRDVLVARPTPRLLRYDDVAHAVFTPTEPGLYRIVATAGSDPVSRLVLVG